jgi:hypothetical protein
LQGYPSQANFVLFLKISTQLAGETVAEPQAASRPPGSGDVAKSAARSTPYSEHVNCIDTDSFRLVALALSRSAKGHPKIRRPGLRGFAVAAWKVRQIGMAYSLRPTKITPMCFLSDRTKLPQAVINWPVLDEEDASQAGESV